MSLCRAAVALAAGFGSAGVTACRSAPVASSSVAPSTVAAPMAQPAPAPRADTGRRGYAPADVRFLQGMIGHHAQALRMAAMVPTHTANPKLHLLAQRIDVSQRDEIALMQRWLREHGEPAPAVDSAAHEHSMAGMAMPGMHGDEQMLMPGMLTETQLAQLDSARGPAFDRLFLEDMIHHHEGALVMVAQLFASPGAAQNSQIFGLATDVDADQRAEIARMQSLLASMRAP